ncbi:MAG: Crp/Fnr family transcriptional regulator [Acidobacteriota bacterium]
MVRMAGSPTKTVGTDSEKKSKFLMATIAQPKVKSPSKGIPKSKAVSTIAAAFDPKEFLSKVGTGRRLKTYKTGEVVFTQGMVADSLFYLQTGKIKLSVVSTQGKEAVVALLEAGSFFGEGCMAGQQIRMATASAMSASSVMHMDKASVLRVLIEQPEFAELFLKYVLARNIRIEEDLVDQLFNSSEKRLARLLLLLANFGKEGKPEEVITAISQETLAEMIGTTRSRVSFFMNKFRKLGFIAYNGGLHVNSSLLNVVLHD